MQDAERVVRGCEATDNGGGGSAGMLSRTHFVI